MLEHPRPGLGLLLDMQRFQGWLGECSDSAGSKSPAHQVEQAGVAVDEALRVLGGMG